MRDRLTFVLAVTFACSHSGRGEELLRDLPLDALDEVITKSGVTFDAAETADGGGSTKIAATDTTVVRIAEIDGLSVERARLISRARLRTEDAPGKAYLEM